MSSHKGDMTSSLADICSASRGYKVTVFSANPDGPKRAGRRKLNTQERSKVHAVRKTGACLSCRMLKVPCDIPDPDNPGPCKRCLAIASRPHQKGLLAFRECIRTKIRDVNIFQHTLDINFTSLSSPKLISLISKTVDPIEVGASSSLAEVVKSIFTWMVPEKNLPPERSIVGALLSSDQFRQLANGGGLLGQELLEKFRVMVYSSTLAYVYDSGSRDVYDSDLTMQDLHRITYAMGSELLLFLDNILAPHHLAKLSHEHLCGLFVLIFGIALAVAYSTSVDESPSFDPDPETSGNTPKTLWQALQQHLSQMLAHHLVLLGSRLGLVLRGDSEREVLSSLMTGMTSRGNFVWVAQQRPVEPPPSSHSPSSSSTSSSSSAQNSTPSQTTESTDNSEELSVLIIPETETKSDPTTGALSMEQLASYRSAPVSARNLQTVQNSLKAVLPESLSNGTSYMQQWTPPKNTPTFFSCANALTRNVQPTQRRYAQGVWDDNDEDTDEVTDQPAQVSPGVSLQARERYFCNRSATLKFKERRGLGNSTPNQPPANSPVPPISQNTQSSPQQRTQSNEGVARATSPETNLLNQSSQIPPSKQPDLFMDPDLDMDLDADPFGVGWLPDPEPEPEPLLEPEPNSSEKGYRDVFSYTRATTNQFMHMCNGISYLPPNLAIMPYNLARSFASTDPIARNIRSPNDPPPTPERAEQQRAQQAAQRRAQQQQAQQQQQQDQRFLQQQSLQQQQQKRQQMMQQQLQRQLQSPYPPPRQYYQSQYMHNMCQSTAPPSIIPPQTPTPLPPQTNTTTTPSPTNNSYFGPVKKRPVI